MRKKFTTAGNWPTLGCTALLLLLAAGATSSGRVAAQGQEVAQGQAPSQAPAPPGGPTQPNRLAAPQIVRELFVPFADLPVVLEHAPQRVLLTRSQYDQLLREAKRTPNDPAPRRASLVSADYEATLSDGRAAISGRIVVDVLERGVHVVPLSLGGVGLRSATLDGQPAPLAIDAADGVVLIVRDPGRKQLQLELVAPLETTAALQSLSARLPRAATSSMKIVVPGNVEVKSGAAVVRRSVDAAANLTRFDLIPHASGEPLVMTLNNRQLLRDRVVISRSVLIDEVTQGYERLHATVSLSVLHG
ncbi:MAG TPA: hypothetical protein PLV92_30075, partial [Pirellulaceae bacterium]|nr:hypothetical protein [Pirellulaceae bacterium]